jgi:hypothetical protein
MADLCQKQDGARRVAHRGMEVGNVKRSHAAGNARRTVAGSDRVIHPADHTLLTAPTPHVRRPGVVRLVLAVRRAIRPQRESRRSSRDLCDFCHASEFFRDSLREGLIFCCLWHLEYNGGSSC